MTVSLGVLAVQGYGGSPETISELQCVVLDVVGDILGGVAGEYRVQVCPLCSLCLHFPYVPFWFAVFQIFLKVSEEYPQIHIIIICGLLILFYFHKYVFCFTF